MCSIEFLGYTSVSIYDLKPLFDKLSPQDLFKLKYSYEWLRGFGLVHTLKSCIDVHLFGKLFSFVHTIELEFNFAKYIISLYQVGA